MTFGGISPVRNQQRMRAVLLVATGGLCLLFAGLAILFLNSNSSTASEQKKSEPVEAPMQMLDVLVPVQNIEAGKKLELSMFRKEKRPKVGLPLSVIRDFEEVKGFYARSLMTSDMPIVRDLITQVRPTNEITTKIPEGYRAVTIRVNAESGVEGWARANARVDVVWTTTVNGQQTLSTIVQNARVLSAAQSLKSNVLEGDTEKGMQIPTTVTLLVSARDSQKIQLAQTSGSLSLSLRGDNDRGKGQVGGSITVKDLLPKGLTPEQDRRYDGTVKVKRPDGGYDTLYLRDGKLEPEARR